MLDTGDLQTASNVLAALWRAGAQFDRLPADLAPADRAEGYAIQALIAKNSKRPLFGWKIAATSTAGQAHINVDGPLAGRLLAERVVANGATRSFGSNHMAVAEAEFAFRMGRDLAPRPTPYSESEVLAAVGSLHPAIEIPDSRFIDFTKVGAAQLIADNACAHEFVLGDAAPENWRSLDLAAHEVRLSVESSGDGETVREGRGVNVLGGPLIALTWLINELSGIGVTLRTSEVVTTGTCVTPPAISAACRITADFADLGVVSVQLSD